jgi:hypothetical protein
MAKLPEHIVSKGIDSPGMWEDDNLEIFLDPGRKEGWRYYHLIVNPAGNVYHAADRDDIAWDPPSLKVAAKSGADAWTVELSIAFKDLGQSPDRLPRVWGANVARLRWAKGDGDASEETLWSPLVRWGDSPHAPDRFGTLYLQAGNLVDPRLPEAQEFEP